MLIAPVQKLLLLTDSMRHKINIYNYKLLQLHPDHNRDKINSWSLKSKNRSPANGEPTYPGRKGRIPEIIITQGHPRGLGCTAVGGSPAPEVKLFIGSKEITDFFALQQTLSLVSSWHDNLSYDDDNDDDEEDGAKRSRSARGSRSANETGSDVNAISDVNYFCNL